MLKKVAGVPSKQEAVWWEVAEKAMEAFAAQEVEAAITEVTKQRDELLEACKMMTEALNHGNFELLIPEYEVMMTVISKVEWDNLEDFNQPIDKPIVM